MKFCASGDVRELMPVAKSTYMRLSRKALSELATALRESYSQRDRQWEALWDWAQLKKDEWPADDERTTTENQVTNQAPDSPPAPPTAPATHREP